jgi:hypothetical protein
MVAVIVECVGCIAFSCPAHMLYARLLACCVVSFPVHTPTLCSPIRHCKAPSPGVKVDVLECEHKHWSVGFVPHVLVG